VEEEFGRRELEDELYRSIGDDAPRRPVFFVRLPAKVHSSGFWQVS